MAFGPPMPPTGPVGPAAPPPPTPPKSKPLAQVSAMGAATAPPGATPMPPASDAPQAQNPAPQAQAPAAPAPPIGIAARPVVAPHATKSVGTHASRSPNKRFNAPHGMVQGAGPAPARPIPPQFRKG